MSEACVQHIEKAWKLKTQGSNELFKKGHYEASLQGYTEALFRAEVLNNHQKKVQQTGVPFLQIFAISCNNLAFTYEKMGLLKKGEAMLKRVVYFLLLQAKNETVDIKKLQIELKRSMLNYSKYAARNGLQIEKAEKVFSDIRKRLKILQPV